MKNPKRKRLLMNLLSPRGRGIMVMVLLHCQRKMLMQTWFVYMVRCGDGSLYTGISVDVERRVALHNDGKGAKYTRARLSVALVWSAQMKTATDARKAEVDLKRLSKKEKEALIIL